MKKVDYTLATEYSDTLCRRIETDTTYQCQAWSVKQDKWIYNDVAYEAFYDGHHKDITEEEAMKEIAEGRERMRKKNQGK